MTLAKDEDNVRRQRRFKSMRKRRRGKGELRKMKRNRKLSRGRRNCVNC